MKNIKIPDLVIPEGSYTERQENLFSTRISATMIDDSYYDYGSNSIVDNNGAVSNGELVFTSPEYESFLVSENISAFLKGISGYYDITGVIPDPQNSNSVIISTTDYDNHIFTFYTYNLITGDLNQFYRTQDINLSQSYVSAVGIQGSKLILSALPEGIGGGPCLNNWIDWSDDYYYIELSDVSQGIKHFTIPAYKLREEQEEVDQCMEDYYAEEEANENIQ